MRAPEDAAGGSEPPCIVGDWQLDVADYGAKSEEYLLGLGVPVEGFAMSGAGRISFSADGLVLAEVALTSTGTIVAGEVSVPFTTPSNYTSTGDWSTGSAPDSIDLANWANVPDPDVAVDPTAPGVPTIDYTDIPTVSAPCTADTLELQGPDAPFSAVWQRG